MLTPSPASALAFTLLVESSYRALMRLSEDYASAAPDSLPGLGGVLLYAGELDESARALMVAGNIAGAATLAATQDPATQRLAIREGVADFVVNSLDEALRILKNEIRKREAVAVCIAAAPEAVAAEMAARGVQPDLLAGQLPASPALATFQRHGALRLSAAASPEKLLAWSVGEAPALWMPQADALVLELLPPADGKNRRWLRQSPRYLGRRALNLRLLGCDAASAEAIAAALREASVRDALQTEVQIALLDRSGR
jgi:hypothetical protein